MSSTQGFISDINLISHFLSDPQVDFSTTNVGHPDCIVIAASAVFRGAEVIFRKLQEHTLKTKTLVLCGGIGHSTSKIYDAVRQHPVYSPLFPTIQGLPEAKVLNTILTTYFEVSAITRAGCRILIEEKSTNCGANASETRRVLEDAGVPLPKTFWIVQDPTMQLRTKASFERVYQGINPSPTFLSCPTFTPRLKLAEDKDMHHDLLTSIVYDNFDVAVEQLWPLDRFCELILGEIPRLRDDEDGYGPKGKQFIAHVDVSEDIESAWTRLRAGLEQHEMLGRVLS